MSVIMIVSTSSVSRLLMDSYFLCAYQMQVQNGYKIGKETPVGTKTPSPKQKVIRPQQLNNSGLRTSTETQHDVADTAAYNIADAEHKSFLAAEAVREAERISRMAEDTESMLQLMTQIYKQCNKSLPSMLIIFIYLI